MSMFSLRSVKRWDHENWNMGVVHTVITDTTKKGATQGSHTTGAHNNNICIFIICQFTDHFSRSVAFFLVQLELQLPKNKETIRTTNRVDLLCYFRSTEMPG